MSDSSPKVSIILPTYNGARYIRQSVDSCLNQTHKNLEIVIVDDGSTDNTCEIIRSYKDRRIKYFRHEKNRGLSHALNTGFAKTTGKYLTWTSDDNYYAKEAIERMVSFLRERNCSFVYCDYYMFEEDDLSNQCIELPDCPALENGNEIGPCFLYSRELMETVGSYDPATELAEDYDYWIRASKKFTMCHMNEPLYFCRLHKKSLTSKRGFFEVKIVDFLVRLKNDILDIPETTSLFVNLIAGKRMKVFEIKRLSSIKLNIVLARVLFSRKINIILTDFKKGRISFEDAQTKLKATIEKSKVPKILQRIL
jgi:glycosyltransferase involved in cell wall biosynthesis